MAISTGVYQIVIGEKFYIGGTVNYERRMRQHFLDLIKERHRNIHLQRAFKKHKNVQWELIEECNKNEIKIIEQRYLDQWFDDPRCMNFISVAVVPVGKKFSEDTKKKMSEAAKRRDPSTRSREPKSDECKRKIGEANGKLGWDGAAEVRRLKATGISQPKIAKLFGVNQSTISDVIRGKTWKVS